MVDLSIRVVQLKDQGNVTDSCLSHLLKLLSCSQQTQVRNSFTKDVYLAAFIVQHVVTIPDSMWPASLICYLLAHLLLVPSAFSPAHRSDPFIRMCTYIHTALGMSLEC